jgi:hypothetical protein
LVEQRTENPRVTSSSLVPGKSYDSLSSYDKRIKVVSRRYGGLSGRELETRIKRAAKTIPFAPLTQQVEYLHGKQKVAGSNPAEGSHSSPQRIKELLESRKVTLNRPRSEPPGAGVAASLARRRGWPSMEDGRGWGPFDTKPSFMVLFPATNEASPSGKAAGFDPAIQRFESFRLRKIPIPPLPRGRGRVVSRDSH